MTKQRQEALCREWIQLCRDLGFPRKDLQLMRGLFWQYDGWKTFKGYSPHDKTRKGPPMSTLTRYKFVKYDTGNGYMREGIEPHPDGMWISYLEYEAHNASQREQLRLANIDQLQTEADLAAMTQQCKELEVAKYPGCKILSLGDACPCKICLLERRMAQLEVELKWWASRQWELSWHETLEGKRVLTKRAMWVQQALKDCK